MNFKDLSDIELLGFLAVSKFAQACVERVGEDYIKGGYFCAVHHTDPDFDKMTEDRHEGTGKFNAERTWYIGFSNRKGVDRLIHYDFGEHVFLAVLAGTVKNILLTVPQVLTIAESVPSDAMTMTVQTVNSKGSSGTSN
jgi:hypothetical protein